MFYISTYNLLVIEMDKSTLTLLSKENLTLTGVERVIGFDEKHFKVDTVLGTILIKGNNLEMKIMDNAKKILEITGIISSFSYEEIKQNSPFLKKLFK